MSNLLADEASPEEKTTPPEVWHFGVAISIEATGSQRCNLINTYPARNLPNQRTPTYIRWNAMDLCPAILCSLR